MKKGDIVLWAKKYYGVIQNVGHIRASMSVYREGKFIDNLHGKLVDIEVLEEA